MSDKEFAERLREVAIEKQSEAWGRVDGGQDCSISALLAEECADRIEAQAAEIERLRGDLNKAVEALQIARVHVANNAQGWSVSRAASRDDLTIVDSILAALTGAKP